VIILESSFIVILKPHAGAHQSMVVLGRFQLLTTAIHLKNLFLHKIILEITRTGRSLSPAATEKKMELWGWIKVKYK